MYSLCTDVRPSQDHRILRMQTVRINLAIYFGEEGAQNKKCIYEWNVTDAFAMDIQIIPNVIGGAICEIVAQWQADHSSRTDHNSQWEMKDEIDLLLISLNVFSEFSDKKYYTLKTLFEPTTSCVWDQDVTITPARCRQQKGSLNLCYIDLSDSLNSLNSPNYWSV